MPNWCDCDLTVTGPEEDVVGFLGYAKGEDAEGDPVGLDFDKFVPQPEPITRDLIRHPLFTEQAAASPDDQMWYYWRMEHWGTKSQPGEFYFEGG